jgi:F-type H+-transporting ATPase subunit delta
VITGSLGRRYARAIFDLAHAQGNLDRVGADLAGFAGAMHTSAELVTVLTNPAIRRADRKRIIDAILVKLGATQLTKTVVQLLLDRERLGAVPSIARELAAMIEARAGRVTAEVTSAQPLTKAQADQLVTALEKISGKKVELAKKEDPALLGGVVAKLGDTVYDGSLRTQLRALKDELAR